VTFANPENITGLFGLIGHVNKITSGLLGPMILLVIASVSFISTKNLGYTTFFTFLVALFLRLLNWLPDSVFYVVIITFGGVAIMMWKKKGQV